MTVDSHFMIQINQTHSLLTGGLGSGSTVGSIIIDVYNILVITAASIPSFSLGPGLYVQQLEQRMDPAGFHAGWQGEPWLWYGNKVRRHKRGCCGRWISH